MGVRRQPADPRARWQSMQPIPGEDEGQAHAAQDHCHPQAEGDDKDKAIGRPVDVDGCEQDDQRVG
jgi:hypothetical protein